MCIKNMKWFRHPIKQSKSHNSHRIQKRRNSYWCRDNGSITFEAALIMPLLVAFMFVFYAAIIAISSQMALQQLAAESAQKLANYMHPIALTSDYLNKELNNNEQADFGDANEGVAELVYEIGGMLPHPLDGLLQEGSKGNFWPAANLAATVLGRDVIESMLIGELHPSGLNTDNIHLIYLQLPDLIHHTDQNVIVALQYDLPFQLPLFGHRFSVREQAMQRVWLPDVRSASYEVNDEASNFIYVLSIEPNPLKPGRKATIKVKTVPNAPITLDVIYKSGNSVAKNLGKTTANDQGEVEWTWHVSGNTTPGIWTLKLTLSETGESIDYLFHVQK